MYVGSDPVLAVLWTPAYEVEGGVERVPTEALCCFLRVAFVLYELVMPRLYQTQISTL